MTEEVADAAEHGVSENKDGNNSSMVNNRNIGDNAEEEERPCSLNSTSIADRRSSLGSYELSNDSDSPAPDPVPQVPDIEGSVAYSSHRKNSIKREKRFLPPDETNVVIGQISLDDHLASDTPPLAVFLRNALVTAIVTEAEKERKLPKDSDTPESLLMDDLSLSSSSVQSGLLDEGFDKDNISQNADEFTKTVGLRKDILHEDKSTKSETYLLDGTSNQPVASYGKRTQSAPVLPAVEFATRCTQTEWSWLEDMRRFEGFKSQLQPSMKISNGEDQCVDSPKGFTIEVTKENDIAEFKEPEDELFKEPTMEVSSESSSEDEQDIMVEVNKELVLPSIGPPKILQYMKESMNPPFTNNHPDKDSQRTFGVSLVDNSYDFTKTEIVERDEVLQQTQVASQEETEEIGFQEVSVGTQEPTTCAIYDGFIKEQSIYKEDEGFVKDEIIDIRPHPPFGTKAARKAAKERAAERAREREMERQKVSGNTVNFYAMTRQMKTLAYSLASTKCMDDGWTLRRPASQSGTESEDTLEPFDIKINSSMTQQKETFFERFYTNGKILLVVFPDGTGSCYYPSGNPAVIISSTEKGKYSYIIQEDTHEHSRGRTGILGVFDPTGHGCCYFQANNMLRMVLTPFGGTYFDNTGVKKKKWLWYNNNGNHVHAPPFQPITFAMTKELSIRCMGQDYIIITYNYGRHTIRFNVGARLKAAKKIKQPTREQDYELELNEIKQLVNSVMEKMRSTLRFPHSRMNKLPLQKPERQHRTPRRRDRKLLDTDDNATVVVN